MTYICKDVRCERSKQTVNATQDQYMILSRENNLLQYKHIISLRQVYYKQRNSLLIQVEVLNRLFTKNCVIWTEILSVSFLFNTFFISALDWCFENRSLKTLFSTQIRGEEKQPQEHQYPCPILLEFDHSSPRLCKNHKNLRSIRKLKHARHFYIDQGLCMFLIQMLIIVGISFINSELVKTLYSVGLLQICSGNNNASFLLYAWEDMHLINKDVTSLYV